MLGAVVPCSPFLINDMLAAVEWDRSKVIVEYGPGIGNITEEILKRMAPDATLTTDTNKQLELIKNDAKAQGIQLRSK